LNTQIRFDLEITLNSAWHVGTGLSRGLLDRTTRRNARGEVYLPASTIKGRVRDACERLARLYISNDEKLHGCQPPDPMNMCRGNDPCVICRIFGSAYVGERLFFEDATLRSDLGEIYDPVDQSHPRTRVKLNRRKGIAEAGHLFSAEYVEPQLVFRTQVMGNLPLTFLVGGVERADLEKAYEAYELILLVAGIRSVKELGGDKSAGFGACEMAFASDIQLRLKPEEELKPVSPTDLIADWLEWLEYYGTEQ